MMECQVLRRRRPHKPILLFGFPSKGSILSHSSIESGCASSCCHSVNAVGVKQVRFSSLRNTSNDSYLGRDEIYVPSQHDIQTSKLPQNNFQPNTLFLIPAKSNNSFFIGSQSYKGRNFLIGDMQFGANSLNCIESETSTPHKLIHDTRSPYDVISCSSSKETTIAGKETQRDNNPVEKNTENDIERTVTRKRQRSKIPLSSRDGRITSAGISEANMKKEFERKPALGRRRIEDEENSRSWDSRERAQRYRNSTQRSSSFNNEKFRNTPSNNNRALERHWMRMLVNGNSHGRKRVLESLSSVADKINVEDINDTLIILSRNRRLKEALALVEVLQQRPLATAIKKLKSVKTYTIMIEIYGRSFQLSRAFSLFYGMMREGLKPSMITYNTVITACSRNNEPELAYEVFEELKQKGFRADKFTYGALIDAHAKCGQVDRAFEISEMMYDDRVSKDQTIYSALLDACGRAKQLDRAFQVFEEMKQNGVWPNLVTFAVLIDMCASARQPEQAFHLFAEIKHWGFRKANVVVYTALIDACGKAGWPDCAEIVMTQMLTEDIRPNEVTFGALIDAWAKGGNLDKAFQVLDRMHDRHGVRPNEILIGSLVDSCRRIGDPSRARELWQTMLKHNVRPPRTLYPTLMSLATNHGDLDVASAIALHAYARGLYRKISLQSDHSTIQAQASALIYLRYRLLKNEGNDPSRSPQLLDRLRVIFNSLPMTEQEMDDVSPIEAYKFCIAWGSADQKGTHVFRQRGGSTKDKNGVFRKDSARSAAARRAKEHASRVNLTTN